MSKFNHIFKIANQTDSCSVYTCDENTVQIDFVSKSCVRVAVYKNKDNLLPTFSVNPGNTFSAEGRSRLSTDDFKLYIPDKKTNNHIQSFALADGIKISLNLNNFILKYYKNDSLLFSDRAPLAYNFENEFGNETYHYITRMLGEKIFGLGDKGGELNKAGRAFRIETTYCMGYDSKESDPLYKHIPF